MGIQTGPGRPRERRRKRDLNREYEAVVVRAVLLSALAGVGAVVTLAGLSAVANIGNTATVAISAVAAIVSAAIGVAAAYLHRRH